MLPSKRHKGSNLLKSRKRYVSKHLPKHTKSEITFTGRKRSSCFSIKDKTSFEHQYDLIHHVNYKIPSSCVNNKKKLVAEL